MPNFFDQFGDVGLPEAGTVTGSLPSQPGPQPRTSGATTAPIPAPGNKMFTAQAPVDPNNKLFTKQAPVDPNNTLMTKNAAANPGTAGNYFDKFGDVAPAAPAASPKGEPSGAEPGGTSHALGSVSEFVHGATFGMDDPIGAALTATTDWLRGKGFNFNSNLDLLNAKRLDFEKAYPKESTGENVVGGVAGSMLLPGGGPLGAVGKSAETWVPAMIKGAKTGAAIGAVQGASGSDFSPGGLAAGATSGALSGGVIGGGLSTVGSAVGSAASRALGSSDSAAAKELALRIQQDVHSGAITPEGVEKQLSTGQPVSLMDKGVGGPNTQRLAGAVYREPGTGSNNIEAFLNGRDQQTSDTLLNTIHSDISGGPSVYQTTNALKAKRSMEATPLFAAADAQPATVTPQMKTILGTPPGQAALNKAVDIITADPAGLNPASMGFTKDMKGNTTLVDPSFQALRYVKQGLDAQVEAYRDGTTQKLNLDPLGNNINKARGQFVDALRDQNPAYGKALDAYAGDSQMLTAVSNGQDILKSNPEETRDYLAGATASEREMFLNGAANTISQAIKFKGGTKGQTNVLAGSEGRTDQLRELFSSPDAFDQFMYKIGQRQNMGQTSQDVMHGSPTAGRQAESAARGGEEGPAVPVALAASGHPLPALALLASRAKSNMVNPEDVAKNATLGKAFTNTDPDFIRQTIQNAMMQRGPAPVSQMATGGLLTTKPGGRPITDYPTAMIAPHLPDIISGLLGHGGG